MAALVFKFDRTRGLAATFAALGLFATILSFSLRGAILTGDVSGMTDPIMLNLLWSTPVGTALALRVVGLSLLLVGHFLGHIGALAGPIHRKEAKAGSGNAIEVMVSVAKHLTGAFRNGVG